MVSIDPAAGLSGRPYRRRFGAGRVILALVLREMATRYVRAPGGVIWAVLEPVGMVLVLSVAFAIVSRTPPLGSSFILFYATGALPFHLFRDIERDVSGAVAYSRPLLMYPSVTWLDAILARFILQSLIGAVVSVVVIGAALALAGHKSPVDLVVMVEATAAAACLGLGVGALNAFLGARSPLYRQMWGIFTRPLFLASGVFHLVDRMPPHLVDLFWWNPLVHIIILMRQGVYPTYRPEFVSMPYVWAVSLASLLFGLLFLRARSRELVNRE